VGYPAFDSLIGLSKDNPSGHPMSSQVDTVKRVYELFNKLPGDAEGRRSHPAAAGSTPCSLPGP
jgi:hypothetical protein